MKINSNVARVLGCCFLRRPKHTDTFHATWIRLEKLTRLFLPHHPLPFSSPNGAPDTNAYKRQVRSCESPMSSQEAETSTYMATLMTHSAAFQRSTSTSELLPVPQPLHMLQKKHKTIHKSASFLNAKANAWFEFIKRYVTVCAITWRTHEALWNHLIADVDVNVFAEGVAFWETSGAVLHQVEGFQRAKWSQQLLHLRIKSASRTIKTSNLLHALVQTPAQSLRAC